MNELDTFPPRNLPPEANEWGRSVENALYQLINESTGTTESAQGLNRTTAASLQSLASQATALAEQVTRINNLYNALPISFQRTDTASNFGLSSSGWNTVATITFVPPSNGTFQIEATMSGQLVSASTSTNMEIEVRLARGSDASPARPGLSATPDGVWQNNFLANWGWTATATPEKPVVISAQIDPVDASSWGSGTGSTIVLSGFATFIPAT